MMIFRRLRIKDIYKLQSLPNKEIKNIILNLYYSSMVQFEMALQLLERKMLKINKREFRKIKWPKRIKNVIICMGIFKNPKKFVQDLVQCYLPLTYHIYNKEIMFDKCYMSIGKLFRSVSGDIKKYGVLIEIVNTVNRCFPLINVLIQPNQFLTLLEEDTLISYIKLNNLNMLTLSEYFQKANKLKAIKNGINAWVPKSNVPFQNGFIPVIINQIYVFKIIFENCEEMSFTCELPYWINKYLIRKLKKLKHVHILLKGYDSSPKYTPLFENLIFNYGIPTVNFGLILLGMHLTHRSYQNE